MSRPLDMGPVKYCRGCSEWWPLASFNKHSQYRDGLRPKCRACVQEAEGYADSGNKGETLFLFDMGETPERIAERLSQPLKSIRRHLRRAGVALPGWRQFGSRREWVG